MTGSTVYPAGTVVWCATSDLIKAGQRVYKVRGFFKVTNKKGKAVKVFGVAIKGKERGVNFVQVVLSRPVRFQSKLLGEGLFYKAAG